MGIESTWHEIGAAGEPAFTGLWVNLGGGQETAAFMKDGLGFVHLKGAIKTGVSGTSAFTLPAGFRPSSPKIGVAMVWDGTLHRAAGVSLLTSGNVQFDWDGGAAATFLGMEGISFKT